MALFSSSWIFCIASLRMRATSVRLCSVSIITLSQSLPAAVSNGALRGACKGDRPRDAVQAIAVVRGAEVPELEHLFDHVEGFC